MTKKLVIAVDCDDVLVLTTPFFVETYNRTYGTNGTLEQSHDSDPVIWQASEELQGERLFSMKKTERYKELAPDPEEVRILHRLAKTHKLHLVTARREEEREFTQAMLDKYLGGCLALWNLSAGGARRVIFVRPCRQAY